MDKAGNFIGWLWIENENLSVALVEHGLASMHYTAESSEFARAIKTAEESAMKKKIGIWKNYVEAEKEVKEKENAPVQDRTVKYEKVVVTEVTPDGTFYVQNVDLGTKLESLMEKIHQEFKANAPLPGSYFPKRGNICAACFTLDNQWYRAKVEKIQDDKAHVFYIDYGNREVLNTSRLAALPAGYDTDPPYATEYVLACIKFPTDQEDKDEAVRALYEDTVNKKLMLNVEIRGSPLAVTLVDPANNQDIGKNLIKEGLVLLEPTRDRRLASLVSDYRSAQDHAKNSRLMLWRHGDITEDDAVEFGARR
ncbi:Staphylococcal nuclease domain-containing protein 1 [Eumeta japonica]|uniref:Staphylococcal nuclease domain-containing protein 1 n=1 Tax=Eumeta variegata TaxID=151549 RepID=A0A4C2AI52_EUMVA|nr:Staphylococcal nuclease domain-containing protein 1 [Eumeta japonica]